MRTVGLLPLLLVVASCQASGNNPGGGSTGSGGVQGGGSGGSAGTGGDVRGSGGDVGGTGGSGAGAGGSAGTAGRNGGGGGDLAGTGGGLGGTGGHAGAAGAAGASGATAGSDGHAGATAGTGGSRTGENGGGGGVSSVDGGADHGGTGGSTANDAGVDRIDATGDGGATFNPCPAAPSACKVMPLGDSITYGAGSTMPEGGYRVPLFRNALKGNQLITFVGRISTGPATVDNKPFPANHEGYRGYTIDPGGGRQGISPLVDDAMTMFHPHIVLLMIGTNDVNTSMDLPNAPKRLGALLDKILSDGPQTLLVVARITPTKTDGTNVRVRAYNDAIPALVQTRAAAGKHIAVVDMYAAFTANASYKTALMNDDLHPNDMGYAVMADTWYAAIRPYLPHS